LQILDRLDDEEVIVCLNDPATDMFLGADELTPPRFGEKIYD